MSVELVGILGIVAMLVLMALRMPIGICLAIVGFLGVMYIGGQGVAFSILGVIPFHKTLTYILATIPTFVLMGEIVYYSGISGELFRSLQKWLGHLRGGLAMATIGACAFFAAASGSSVASAATMGRVAVPEMEKLKYDRKLATGTVAAGGTLGILIPPSTVFIIYGALTEQSIGKLFIAGIFPGIALALLFMLAIYIRVSVNKELAPMAGRATWKERIVSLRGIIAIVILFVFVMGGIYLGIFTPSEAGGTGAFMAFLIALAARRFSWSKLVNCVNDTIRITCMIFAIIIGAMVFNYFLVITNLPAILADFVVGLPIPPLGILASILLLYAVLGCVMDALAMVIITIPIFFPTILALGFNPIWFGVLIVLIFELALITPPVGMNCYVLKGAVPQVPLEDIFRGIIMFIPPMIVAVLIVVFFPQVALFLPGTMR